MRKTYSEMSQLETFSERLEYLKLTGVEYQSPREISLSFYKSRAWLITAERIKIRDLGCDLGVFGVDIDGPIFVHHINPITQEDIETNSWKLYSPENLISTSLNTHNIIHYRTKPQEEYVERTPGDTTIWKKEDR